MVRQRESFDLLPVGVDGMTVPPADEIWGRTESSRVGQLGGYGDRLTLAHHHGRRHEYTYLAADIFNDEAISELPMRDVQFNWQINKPGELSGTIAAPELPNIRDYFTATVPGRTAIYVLRDGQPVWGGIIWKRTFGSDSREVKIEADTWDSYMYHRILDEDWMFLRDVSEQTPPEKRHEGVEQIEIFRYLWRYMADTANGDIKVILGDQTSTVMRGAYFSKWDFKTYGEHLEAFAKKVDGFEWCSVIGVSADRSTIQRRIDFAYPKFGRVYADSGLVWEYPGWTLRYAWIGDSDKAATVAFVTGGGDGDLKAYYQRTNDQAFADNWPRLDQVWNHSTVWDQGILKSHAGKYLEAYFPPISSIELEVHPRVPVEVGDFFLGDEVRLVIDDDLFYLANIQEQDMLARIKGITVKPNDDGLEQVTPTVAIVSRDLVIVDEEDATNDLVPGDWNGPTIDAPDVIPEALLVPAISAADRRASMRQHRGLRGLAGDPLSRWGASRE